MIKPEEGYSFLTVGDPAPWFDQRTTSTAQYAFSTVAGRYIVLCFYLTTSDENGQRMLDLAQRCRPCFNDEHISFFGISIDPDDVGKIQESIPGIRFFYDFDYQIAKLYGAAPIKASQSMISMTDLRQFWVVLNPNLQIRHFIPAQPHGLEQSLVESILKNLPHVDNYAGIPIQAPVIILPHVFEPDLCDYLISLFLKEGGGDSGYMKMVDGKVTGVFDYTFKRRSDFIIEDAHLKNQLQQRIIRRLVPEMKKAYHFVPTRMERYIVSCYDSDVLGHFSPHRDNDLQDSSHRQFALSLNLNDDFEGGDLLFPEYGHRPIKIPKGCAVLFSGTLLHAVTPVTKGKRFAFLPFIYNEIGAEARERNNAKLADADKKYIK